MFCNMSVCLCENIPNIFITYYDIFCFNIHQQFISGIKLTKTIQDFQLLAVFWRRDIIIIIYYYYLLLLVCACVSVYYRGIYIFCAIAIFCFGSVRRRFPINFIFLIVLVCFLSYFLYIILRICRVFHLYYLQFLQPLWYVLFHCAASTFVVNKRIYYGCHQLTF